jgi:hypothetical protein
MKQNLEQMRSLLHSSGLLADTGPDEFCLVVVPSQRVRAGKFAILLQDNGVRCRALGHGDGKVCDQRGVVSKVRGILVLAVHRSDGKKAELYARLFGVTAVPVERTTPDSDWS